MSCPCSNCCNICTRCCGQNHPIRKTLVCTVHIECDEGNYDDTFDLDWILGSCDPTDDDVGCQWCGRFFWGHNNEYMCVQIECAGSTAGKFQMSVTNNNPTCGCNNSGSTHAQSGSDTPSRCSPFLLTYGPFLFAGCTWTITVTNP